MSTTDGGPLTRLAPNALSFRSPTNLHASSPSHFAEHQDNFYTPKNDFFYSQNPYLSLDGAKREIRLLRVFPRKTYTEHLQANPSWIPFRQRNGLPYQLTSKQLSTVIKQYGDFGSGGIPDLEEPLLACEILDKTPLSRVSGAYCALSYHAGKATDTQMILVNGMPFNAFANLEYAIGLALERWSNEHRSDQELLLWVDQVCINQQDYVERADQVDMMREIYRRSSETLICLESATSLDPLAWVPAVRTARDERGKIDDLVHTFKNIVENNLAPQQWPPTSERKSPKGVPIGRPARAVGARARSRSTTSINSSQESLDIPRAVNSLVRRRGPVEKPRKAQKAKKHEAKSDLWLESLQACLNSPWWSRAWVYQEFIVSPQPRFISSSATIPWALLEPLLRWTCVELSKHADQILRASEKTHSAKALSRAEKTALDRQFDDSEVVHRKYEQDARKWTSDRKRKEHKCDDVESEIADLEKKIRQAEKKLGKLDLFMDAPLVEGLLGKKSRWRLLGADLEEDLSKLKKSKRKIKKELAALEADLEQYRSMPPAAPRDWKNIESGLKAFWKNERCLLAFRRDNMKKLNQTAAFSMVTAKSNARRKADLKMLLQHARNCKSSDPRDRIYAFIGLAHDEYGLVPSYAATNTIVHVLVESAQRIITFDRSLEILHHVHRGREKLVTMIPTWVPDWTSKEAADELEEYAKMLSSKGEQVYLNKSDRSAFVQPEYRVDEWSEGHVDLKVRARQLCILEEAGVGVSGYPGLKIMRQGENCKIVAPKSALHEDEVWVIDGASRPVLLRGEGKGNYAFLGEVIVINAAELVKGVQRVESSGEKSEQDRQWSDIWLI